MDEYWAGDVLVIGGGLAGLLTTINLQQRGVATTLLEREGLGAQQSNHSHGYLHQGYIYAKGQIALVKELRKTTPYWSDLLTQLELRGIVRPSMICFTNGVNAAAAASLWNDAGLSVVPSEIPGEFQPEVVNAFITPECSLDFTPVLRHFATQLEVGSYIQGRAIRISGSTGAISGVIVDLPTRQRIRLRARCYVLAAGTSNETLIHSLTRYRGRAVTRTSYMLVAAGSTITPVSNVIIPEDNMYGFFAAVRPGTELGDVLLVSNYLSYTGNEHSREAMRCWVIATLRTLNRVMPNFLASEPKLKIYRAQKAELRANPNQLGSYAVEDYGTRECLVISPTKLTLCPPLAEAAGEEVVKRLSRSLVDKSLLRVKRYPDVEHPAILPERWRDSSFSTLLDFLRTFRVDPSSLRYPQ